MCSKILAVSAVLLFSLPHVTAYSQTKSTSTPGSTGSGNQVQPQGETGPINTDTGSKGAPASSAQGDTPPGMQAAPKGSSSRVKTETSGEPTADQKR